MSNKPEIFKTREAAEIDVARMVDYGWPQAHAKQVEDGYIIVCHAPDCTCGMCPIARDSGFVE